MSGSPYCAKYQCMMGGEPGCTACKADPNCYVGPGGGAFQYACRDKATTDCSQYQCMMGGEPGCAECKADPNCFLRPGGGAFNYGGCGSKTTDCSEHQCMSFEDADKGCAACKADPNCYVGPGGGAFQYGGCRSKFNSVEGFGGDSKKDWWMWLIIGLLALAFIVVLILYLSKKR